MSEESIYRIGYSSSSLLSRLRSGSLFEVLEAQSIRERQRYQEAYELLLSDEARREAILHAPPEDPIQQMLDAIPQRNELARKVGLDDETLNYLRTTLPSSTFVSNEYESIDRGELARKLDQLFRYLDSGLNNLVPDNGWPYINHHSLPSWMHYDANREILYGKVPDNYEGRIHLQIEALGLSSDVREGQNFYAYVSREDMVNRLPYLSRSIYSLSGEGGQHQIYEAFVDTSYQINIPSNFFNDDDSNERMQVSASLTGSNVEGSAWPGWLVFDENARIFSGIPPASELGKSYTFQLTATDSSGGQVSTSFTLDVKGKDDSPLTTTQLPSLIQGDAGGNIDALLRLQDFVSGLEDIDLEHLRVSLENGLVPSWLHFSVDYQQTPEVKRPIASQAANIGQAQAVFTYVPEYYLDDTQAEKYRYGAQIQVGGVWTDLPDWLELDQAASSLRFSGTNPPDDTNIGTYDIKFTVHDETSGASVEQTFQLNVNAEGTAIIVPSFRTEIPRQTVTQSGDGTIQLPQDLVRSNSGYSVHDYQVSVTLQDGSPLPSYLAYDPNNPYVIEKVGRVPDADSGKIHTLLFTAVSPQGYSNQIELELEVFPDNPLVTRQLADVVFYAQEDKIQQINQDIIKYSGEISYAARLQGGGDLPEWLKFDAETATFSIDNELIDAATIYGKHGLEIVITNTVVETDSSVSPPTSTSTSYDTVSKLDVYLNQQGTQNQQLPQAETGLIERRATADYNFNLALQDLFSAPSDGEVYGFQLSTLDGSSLPPWLSFDASNGDITIAPSTSSNADDVSSVYGTSQWFSLKATDARGESAVIPFRLDLSAYDPDVYLQVKASPPADADVVNDVIIVSYKNRQILEIPINVNSQEAGRTPFSSGGVVDDIVIQRGEDFLRLLELNTLFNDNDGVRYFLTQENGEVLPDWLQGVINQQDALGIKQAIRPQAVNIDDEVKIGIDLPSFLQDDGVSADKYLITATLANGDPLPDWLEFDSSENEFTFKGADASDVGEYNIKVAISDISDGYAINTEFAFTIQDSYVDIYRPEVEGGIRDWAVGNGEVTDLTISEDVFSALPDGQTYRWEVSRPDGLSLPAWLSWDESTKTLNKIADAPIDTPLTPIRVMVVSEQGASTAVTFNVKVYDEEMYWQSPATPQAISVDEEFAISLSHIFSGFIKDRYPDDPNDPSNNLIFSARLANGDPLPAWMEFDSDSLAIKSPSGVLPEIVDIGEYIVHVKVENPLTGEVKVFAQKITLNGVGVDISTPQLRYGLNLPRVESGVSFSFQIPEDVIEDGNYDLLLTMANGASLPAWLNYNSVTRTIQGTPPTPTANGKQTYTLRFTYVDRNTGASRVITKTLTVIADDTKRQLQLRAQPGFEDVGEYNLALRGIDQYGQEIIHNFKVSVEDVNVAPEVATQLDDLTYFKNQQVEIEIESLFADKNQNDALTYSFDNLPGWLSYDVNTHKLQGVPDETHVGVLSFAIRATDSQGESVSQQVRVEVVDSFQPQINTEHISYTVPFQKDFSIDLKSLPITDLDHLSEDLQYSIHSLNDETPLPQWLHYDSFNRVISGFPQQADKGEYKFLLKVTDPMGGYAEKEINIKVTDGDKPVVTSAMPDLNLVSGQEFSYQLPKGLFTADNDVLQYEIKPSWSMTNSQYERFRKISEMLLDELLQKPQFKDEFDTVDEVSARRMAGYLQVMSYLTVDNGREYKNNEVSFDFIKEGLGFLEKIEFQQLLDEINELLPPNLAYVEGEDAFKVAVLSEDMDKIMTTQTGNYNQESTENRQNSILKRIDKIFGFDAEEIYEKNKPDVQRIGNDANILAKTLKILIGDIFLPVLGTDKNPDYEPIDVGLSLDEKRKANIVYTLLLDYMSFEYANDINTIDDIPSHEKQTIVGLLKALDYFTGGDGKKFQLGRLVEALPADRRAYAVPMLEEINEIFKPEQTTLSDSNYEKAVALVSQFNNYLSLDDKLRQLHAQNMNEIQFQIETVLGVKNSPTLQALLQGAWSTDFSILLGMKGGGPGDILQDNLLTTPATRAADISWIDKLFQTDTT